MAAMITNVGVLSFPNLFTPKPRSQGGEPVFSCALLFDQKAQQEKEFLALQDAVRQCAIDEFGLKVNMAALMMPFRDAGEKADKYQGYEAGKLVINPWSKQKPGVVGPDVSDIIDPNSVYAGQLARLQVAPFAWTNSGKRGVSLGLYHVQIVDMNAPRIDGRAPASAVFGAVGSPALEDAPF